MPSNWLAVPHFPQEHDYSCVTACARMVLAHHGDLRTEVELRLLLDTQSTGTRAGNLMRLSSPSFEVHLRPSNVGELEQLLIAHHPPVIFLQTGLLEYWTMDIYHTVILVGLETATVAVNDPFFESSPQITSMPSFEKAWAKTGQLIAIIRPRRKP
jgi:ABC-type bacteriocin/lantibiotic exporter with double-glycine peptidase domain